MDHKVIPFSWTNECNRFLKFSQGSCAIGDDFLMLFSLFESILYILLKQQYFKKWHKNNAKN